MNFLSAMSPKLQQFFMAYYNERTEREGEKPNAIDTLAEYVDDVYSYSDSEEELSYADEAEVVLAWALKNRKNPEPVAVVVELFTTALHRAAKLNANPALCGEPCCAMIRKVREYWGRMTFEQRFDAIRSATMFQDISSFLHTLELDTLDPQQ